MRGDSQVGNVITLVVISIFFSDINQVSRTLAHRLVAVSADPRPDSDEGINSVAQVCSAAPADLLRWYPADYTAGDIAGGNNDRSDS